MNAATVELTESIQPAREVTPKEASFDAKQLQLKIEFESKGRPVNKHQSWGYITFKPRGAGSFTQHFTLESYHKVPEGLANWLHHFKTNKRKAVKLLTEAIDAEYAKRRDIKIAQVHVAAPKTL